MIEIYKRTLRDEGLKKVESAERGSWVCVIEPTREDIKILNQMGLDISFIHDTLDLDELPRIEVSNGNAYTLIQVPYEEDSSIHTIPLSFIITRELVVTVCAKRIPLLEDFFSEKFRFYTTQKTKFLIQIFARTTLIYERHIKKISKNIKQKRISIKELKNDDVVYLVEMEDVLNNFVTNLVPTINNFEKILNSKIIRLYKEDENLVSDLVIDNRQTLDLCKTSLKSMGNIRNAYSTILTNDLNRIMKFLTAVTILLTIPTIIASIYGMNVHLPFGSSPFAFVYVLIMIVVLGLALLLVFYKNKWL